MTGRRFLSFVTILLVSLLAGLGFISCEKAVEGVTEILFTNVKSGKVSLSLGEEFKLKYMVMPEQLQETAEIEWESSDRNVAVVRRGVIEAKGPGEATITASSGNAKASVLVTVKAIQVEDLDFPSNTISVYLDATVEVRFRNVTPADASLRTVEWEIKDTGDGDATVEADDDCIYITGTKIGAAELYGYIDGKEIGHQKIDIKERIPVTSVSVTLSKQSVKYGESLTFSTTVLPSNASIKDVKVTCSPASYASISGYTITAGQQAGTVTVTATADGVSGTAEFEIVPPPLELTLTGDFGENNSQRILSPDASVGACPKKVKLSMTSNYEVELTDAVWTSSNPAVATVDNNGEVTAVGHGWTDISAKVTSVYGEGTGTLRVRSVKGKSLEFKAKRYNTLGNFVETANVSTPDYDGFYFYIDETSLNSDSELDEYWLWRNLGISFTAVSSDSRLLASINTGLPMEVCLTSSGPVTEPVTITLKSNFGQSFTVTSKICIGSVSFVGYDSGKIYATVQNGGKASITMGTSGEAIFGYINVGDSFDSTSSMKIQESPYDNAWTATQDGKQASLPFSYSRLGSTSSKERVVSTTALGGFSFTLSSKY